MPALYLSHGAPMLLDDAIWTGELGDWATNIERPKAILIVSAHWEDAPLSIGATTTVPLVYDFYGFPEHYYQVTYPAPGAPALAERVRKLVSDLTPTASDPERGLDHGAYIPLIAMYPEADIPVLQISMPSRDPHVLLEIGRRLAPLRDEGVLIVGSGFMTHNLRIAQRAMFSGAAPEQALVEFDQWTAEALARQDVDALLDYAAKAPAVRVAHPTVDHFVPLFIALGASLDDQPARTRIEGFAFGNSKRSVEFDSAAAS
jgi:4,5-DOPA dioxygenase extradiol